MVRVGSASLSSDWIGELVSVSPRAHLVVVLPGIGGSRLTVPGDPSRVVWDAAYSDVGNLLVRPERLSLDRYPALRPLGLIRSRALFGIFAKIDGYEGLLEGLAGLPDVVFDDGANPVPNLGANVVAVGYDFRLGVAHAAEYLDGQVAMRLKALWPNPKDRRGRVIFVAHSMGGLVARYWLAQGDNAELCRELITLGTPHRGAPKALDLLANGVSVLGVHVIKGEVRELVRSWQSVYDLLPTEREVHDLTVDASDKDAWRDVYGLPVGWDPKLVEAARTSHRIISDKWAAMPVGIRPSVQPRIGFGHGTQRSCAWDGRRVHVTKKEPGRPGLGLWAERWGDGTVPVLSGLPAEMPEVPTGLWVAARHGQIVNLPEVMWRVQEAEGYPVVRPTEGAGIDTVLGVDLEELAIAGEGIPVTATVRGLDLSRDAGRCVASVVPDAGGSRGPWVELAWDGVLGCFAGDLPGLPAGGFTVRFDWAAGDALTTLASLEVIDPDQPGLDLV